MPVQKMATMASAGRHRGRTPGGCYKLIQTHVSNSESLKMHCNCFKKYICITHEPHNLTTTAWLSCKQVMSGKGFAACIISFLMSFLNTSYFCHPVASMENFPPLCWTPSQWQDYALNSAHDYAPNPAHDYVLNLAHKNLHLIFYACLRKIFCWPF